MRNTILILLALAVVGALGYALLGPGAAPPTVEWEFGDPGTGGPPNPRMDPSVDPVTGRLDDGATGGGREDTTAGAGRSEDPVGHRAVELTGRVVDQGAMPIAGAEVFLTLQRVQRGASGQQIVEPVVTDSRGRFRFRGPAYTRLNIVLEAFRDGFAPTVELRRLGEVEPQVQLDDLVLTLGSTATGRVVDENGAALVGARLALRPARGHPAEWGRQRERLQPTVESTGGGYFSLPRLAQGDYYLQVELAGYEQGTSPTFTVPGNGSNHALEDVVLRKGTTLRGVVRSREGRFVPRARVQVREAGSRSAFREATDNAGEFAFAHLAAAEFDLSVNAPGYLEYRAKIDPRQTPVIEVTIEDGITVRGLVVDEAGAPVPSFAAKPRRLQGLPQEAGAAAGTGDGGRPAPSLGGSSRSEGGNPSRDGSSGGLQDGGMTDRPGSARNHSPFPASAGPPQRHPDGRFEFEGLLEGIYVIDVSSPTHQDVRTAPFELRVGGPPVDMTITLPAGLSLTGTVTLPDGTAAGGASVELRHAQQDPSREAQPPDQADRRSVRWSVNRTTTDGGGRYSFEHCAAGRYMAAASLEGFAEVESREFTLAGPMVIDLTLLQFGSLEGRVQGEGNMEDVQVFVLATDSAISLQRTTRATAKADAIGNYRFDALSPGTYRVRAVRGSGRSSWMVMAASPDQGDEIRVPAGGVARFNPVVTDPPVGQVVGRVVGDRQPSGLRVFVQGPVEEAKLLGGRITSMRSGTVAADGTFTVANVPEGPQTLWVTSRASRMRLFEQELFVNRERDTAVDIVLDLMSVRGTVTAPDGATVDGRAVFLRGGPVNEGAPGTPGASAATGQRYQVPVRDGRFAADDIPRDRYVVRVEASGFTGSATLSPAAGPGQQTEVAIQVGR